MAAPISAVGNRKDLRHALLNGADGYFLQARLKVSLPGVEREVAQSIVDGAHQICPYSKATRGNIKVDLSLA